MVTQTIGEQRVVLRDISWDTYERILADHASQSAPRITFDRGTLEIVSPLPNHEQTAWALREIAQTVAEHRNIDFTNLGSTTFRRSDLDRGFEPDSCFYFSAIPILQPSEPLDLSTNPPPDLVIEVDMTHSSIDKLTLLAVFGVPELWRYRDQTVEIYHLFNGAYRQVAVSVLLPGVEADAISRFVADLGDSSRLAWLRRVRTWAAALAG